MNSGMESNGVYLSPECNEMRSTFDLVPPSDWSSYRTNNFGNMPGRFSNFDNNQRDARMLNLLPPLGFESRQNPVFDMNAIMQPNMVQFDRYRQLDGYWKNYWQDYYRRADSFYGPRFDRGPRFEQGPRFEREEQYFDRDMPDAHKRFRPHRAERPGHFERPEHSRHPERGWEQEDENPTRSFDRGTESGRIGNIVRSAKDSVGQQLFKFIPGTPGRLGCAASVSAALSKAGFDYAKHAGVGGLSEILQRHGWTKHEGLQNAQPGDVVVIGRNARWAQGGGSAHIGIVGENGKVYHNSSARQQWVEDSLQRVFSGGVTRFILRPPRA